jgi:gas vesicle protein
MNNNNKLLYLLAGTGIGAIVGMLLSPTSGQEMRNRLSTRAHEGMDRLSQKVEEGRRYVEESEVGRRAGEKMREVVEKGKNVADIGRRIFNESIEAGKNRFNEALTDDQTETRPDRQKDFSAL